MDKLFPASTYFNKEYPFLIAGPCSAETEEQVLATAKGIYDAGIAPQLFRAGIWKPRTRPGSFEGSGEQGLAWLKQVKETYGWGVACEVAQPAHIELALKYGVDVLWIGARTTVNPFLIQELADVLKGVDIPIMVKNPVSADLELWIGALERMQNAGIKDIAAIHRGFTSFEKTAYRNNPTWEVPIELMRRYPDLAIICDPSHITGRRDMLLPVAQRAIDLRYTGLMIETHSHPDAAWTDAAQQLTPEALKQLLDKLSLRRQDTDDPVYRNTIEELRVEIDKLDEELLEVLAARMAYCEKLGVVKRDNNIAIFQPRRWDEVLQSRTASAMVKHLSVDIVARIFELVHEESMRHQAQVYHGSEVKEQE